MDMTARERELLDELDDDARAHPLFRDSHNLLRFEQRIFPADLGKAIREIWNSYGQGETSRSQILKFYRDIGYSLGGYCELIDNGTFDDP